MQTIIHHTQVDKIESCFVDARDSVMQLPDDHSIRNYWNAAISAFDFCGNRYGIRNLVQLTDIGRCIVVAVSMTYGAKRGTPEYTIQTKMRNAYYFLREGYSKATGIDTSTPTKSIQFVAFLMGQPHVPTQWLGNGEFVSLYKLSHHTCEAFGLAWAFSRGLTMYFPMVYRNMELHIDHRTNNIMYTGSPDLRYAMKMFDQIVASTPAE